MVNLTGIMMREPKKDGKWIKTEKSLTRLFILRWRYVRETLSVIEEN